MLDLDLIGFEFVASNARGLLDLFKDANDLLQIAVQSVEKFVDGESHGR